MLAIAVCMGVACAPVNAQEPVPGARGFDAKHTRYRFDVRARWGQHVGGTFARHDGALTRLPDGRQQVRVRLEAGAVQVAGPQRYTALARGEKFFDAQRFPDIEFISDPHHPALLREGGPLRGTVLLHGQRRAETFAVEPSRCDRPGEDCDIVARGKVSRAAYGMNVWSVALADSVLFTLRVRYAPVAP